MSSNSRAKTHISTHDELLNNQNKITELHTMMRSLQGPQIGSRPLPGTARSATETANALSNYDAVLFGVISYTPKVLSMSSTSIDLSKATNTGFTSRLILANPLALNLVTIAGAEHAGQQLELQGVLTESILIKTTGNIRTQSGSDVLITGNQVVLLSFDAISNKWVVKTKPTASTSFISFTADADLNMGSFDIINVDRFIPTIDSSAFPTPLTSGILLSSVGLHYNVQNLKAHKFQVQEVDQFIITGDPAIGTSLQGNDLTQVDDLFFTTSGSSITHDSSGIDFNLPSGDLFEFYINSSLKFRVGANEINLVGNDIIDADDIFFLTGQSITADSSGLQIRVPTADNLDIYVNGVLEWEFSATSIQAHGNTIQDLASIFFSTSGQSFQTGTSGFSLVIPAGDTFDFYVNLGLKFQIAETAFDSFVDFDMNDFRIQKIKHVEVHENYASGFAPVGITDTGIIFCRPTAGGKTELRVVFQTGSSQLLATEP